MDNATILFSGSIRFSDEYNIGIYIIEHSPDPQIMIVDENTGEAIYGEIPLD